MARARRKRDQAIAELAEYRRKRRFDRTSEPAGDAVSPASGGLFVVQKHAARRLHYDLRLQFGGVLKSWAVTKVPSFDPAVRRLAVHVEDHPLAYADFEGTIPAGEYGGGAVLVWDRGTWSPLADPEEGYARGSLKFRLDGEKLHGGWALVRMKPKSERERRENWLLIKERDDDARRGDGADSDEDKDGRSVLSGRTIAEMQAPPATQAAALPGARTADMPDFVAPQLASPRDDPPDGDGWLHEIKLDGYRTLARIENGSVRFLTRNGLDWTGRYGRLGEAFAGLPCQRALIDGEILVQDERGVSDFAKLQDALATGSVEALLFFAFDLLYLDETDLREMALLSRKLLLVQLLAGTGRHGALQLSSHIDGDGRALLGEACRIGVEGIVSKRRDAPYRSGRSRSWWKCKCTNAGDFVIVGYTRSEAAGGLAALLLAEADEGGGLSYVGKTGTGFTRAVAADLEKRLAAIATDRPAVEVPREVRSERPLWVVPTLIAEVRYATRTSDGRIRHSSYRGLRADKLAGQDAMTAPPGKPAEGPAATRQSRAAPAKRRQSATADPPAAAAPIGPARRWVSDADLASVWVTNPERVMFGGPTKLDLALYYARVGDWLLSEVAGRPLTLVRCPNGEAKNCFYQRNPAPGMPEAIRRTTLPPVGDDEAETVLHIEDAAGLLALAQFGVVEIHCRGSRIAHPERPDRLVFDLDPEEGLDWRLVVEAALLLRDQLSELGFLPFVKTTGGKGLHVVIPVTPQLDWPAIIPFAEGFATTLAKADPARFTAQMAKKARKGRIFIDYLRNGRTATAVAAYSLRARAGLPVATPIGWDELEHLDDPRGFDYRSVPERLARLTSDPWRDLDAAARAVSRRAWQFVGVPGQDGEEDG